MSQKRQHREEGTHFEERRPRKTPSFKSVVWDVINTQRLKNLMVPVLEPLIRQVVKEEVDTALRNYIISRKRNCGNDAETSEPNRLQLQFSNPIALPVFTGTRIDGEGCTRMKVTLLDTLSGHIVSIGPGSSAKVEIVVLEGDFDGNEKVDWSLEEFRNNIVREREGKKPLLIGDVVFNLKDGKGVLGDVMFTDNSSWTKSRKFRLGARLLDDIDGIRVKEARSEAFVVRDHRGELYKKHHPPSLSDEVWRLEKIGKDGAFHKRLRKERINTVQDFLWLHSLDPKRLRNILGNGMSGKMWNVAVEHARTCVLDEKLYLYNACENDSGFVFNAIGQVMGIRLNGQFVPADKLTEAEKEDARHMAIAALSDRDKIVTFDDESLLKNIPTSSREQPSPNFPCKYSHSQKIDPQQSDSPDYMQPLYSLESLGGFDDPMEIQYDQSFHTDSLICDTDPMGPDGHLQYFDTDCSIHTSSLEFTSDIQTSMSSLPYSPVSKPQKGWTILFSLLRWRFSIKRIVARKSHC